MRYSKYEFGVMLKGKFDWKVMHGWGPNAGSMMDRGAQWVPVTWWTPCLDIIRFRWSQL